MKLLSLLFALCLFGPEALAQAHRSDLRLREVEGWKYPNSAQEGTEPVMATALGMPENPGGFTELLPFALRSPDQEEAGSCLYMSLTGIAEWYLAKLNPRASRTPDGPIDLSERYMMGVAGLEEDENGIENWKTDTIYLYNKMGSTIRNVDYRFTKGWWITDEEGEIQPAKRSTPGATYDAYYNWIDERDSLVKNPMMVKLPRFKRDVLFADPESNQWNTGVMPDDIIDRIKEALVENKAPVHILYNHFGYWHATVLLGFDDEQDNMDCKFVRRFMTYMPRKAREYREKAAHTKNSKERARLIGLAEKHENVAEDTRRAWKRGGGCHPKGVFYVRDSIYGDKDGGLIYDYDLSKKGEESPYSKTTVMIEYDFVRYMANHATQIMLE